MKTAIAQREDAEHKSRKANEKAEVAKQTADQAVNRAGIPMPKPALEPAIEVKEITLGSKATVRKTIGPGILREFKSGRLEYADKGNALNKEDEVKVSDKKLFDSVEYYLVKKESRGGWLTKKELTEHLSLIPSEDMK